MKIFNRVMALTMIVLLILLAFVITAPPAQADPWPAPDKPFDDHMWTMGMLLVMEEGDAEENYENGHTAVMIVGGMMDMWWQTIGKQTPIEDRAAAKKCAQESPMDFTARLFRILSSDVRGDHFWMPVSTVVILALAACTNNSR